jgi:A/G-specific adenine glycosylase
MSPSPASLTRAAPAFRRALVRWYARHRRALPWRQAPSAYRTVVSELMLQQTQVATVLPYFDRWTQRWPGFADLARADEGEVLAAWAGLGYYRRARLLHALAKAVVTLPRPPTDAAGWRELPGVGPYTAAAVASIAFGDPAAVVDGNVVRVIARLAGLRGTFPSTAAAVKAVTPLAARLLDPRRPGDHNQAMMELGATVCRKAAPACDRCPVSRWCASHGKAAGIPAFAPKARKVAQLDRALVIDRRRVLLRRHAKDASRLAGLAELPLLSSLGLEPGEPLAIRRRTITTTTYEERIHRLPAAKVRVLLRRQPDLEWVPLADLPFAAVSGPHLRWIGELG